jgi:hypothetical protein
MNENFDRHRDSERAYNDVFVRKGCLAAFLSAARRFDAASSGSAEAVRAADDIRAVLPAIAALNVFEVFALKSARVRALVQSLDSDLAL